MVSNTPVHEAERFLRELGFLLRYRPSFPTRCLARCNSACNAAAANQSPSGPNRLAQVCITGDDDHLEGGWVIRGILSLHHVLVMDPLRHGDVALIW